MGTLAKIIKAVIKATLLNKTARYATIGAFIKSAKYLFRPATISKIRSLFSGRYNVFASLINGIIELALLRSAKRAGFSGAGALSVLAAILLAMMRGRQTGAAAGSSSKRQENRVIDLDEYTIIDDRH